MSEINIKVNVRTDEAASDVDRLKSKVDGVKVDAERPIVVHVKVDEAERGLDSAKEKTSGLKAALQSIASSAFNFNNITSAVSTLASGISSATTEIAALTTEQDQLNSTSLRLGLNFDNMASAAGRFVDETQAMTLATELQAHGMQINQTQGEALMKAIGAASVRQNISMREAQDSLLEAVIRGREQGLQPYGEAVSALAGASHTAAERLNAVVVSANNVQTASDTASDRVERLRDSFDDSKRTLASSFTRELMAISAITQQASGATSEVQDFSVVLNNLGEDIAINFARAASAIQVAGTLAKIAYQEIRGQNTDTAIAELATAMNQRDAIEDRANTRSVRRIQDRSNALIQAGIAQGEAATRAALAAENATTPTRRNSRGGATRETAEQIAQQQEEIRLAQVRNQEAGRTLTLDERVTQATTALSRAHERLALAQTAVNTGGATRAERTQLLSALNAETTAKNNLAQATANAAEAEARLQETRNTEGKASRASLAVKEQEQQEQRDARSAAQKNALNEQYTRKEATRAQITKERNDQLAGSARSLAAAQISAAFAAAAAGENAGEAMQKALKASLQALAQESSVKALFELAEGFSALATPTTVPFAAAHFTSAAIFGATAVAAGVGGALIPDVASSSTPAGSTSAAGTSATPNRQQSQTQEAPKNITINMNAFQSNDQAQALIVRSLREAGYAGRNQIGSTFRGNR